MMWILLGVIVILSVLAYHGARLWIWTLAVAVTLLALQAAWPWWLLFALPATLFNLPYLRRRLVVLPIMRFLESTGAMPEISDTERDVLDAGTVWLEGELFSGKPNFGRILSEGNATLTAEETAFLAGPVEEVCAMCSDWEITRSRDLPATVWSYLAEHGFFGLAIPPEFGGRGFKPAAVSAIVGKLSARSATLGITVMVPNSLGPAELLLHYGTPEQKSHWLPRLARGEELPCFALTEPMAGSDAGAITSRAEVFRGADGAPWLRLYWNKRYITLAGRATVVGLAVKLEDTENLLGAGVHAGITCVLVPASTPGVVRDRRHDPLGVPFWNCPTSGEGVEVPATAIVGGPAGAGRGWRMLMESLAAGRGIMLPALSTCGLKMTARVASAHALVRRQFGLPIGRFEGIEEPLARLGGWAYTLDAGARFLCGGLADGAKPAVASAIAKWAFTETFRKGVTDGMDILGGNGISLGPRNLLASAHIASPISITVEGANILTRTLMIFGQGAIRCHPYAYAELKALLASDVPGFDRAFGGHVRHVVRNATRAKFLFLTRGHLARVRITGPGRRYAQKLAWASASFALHADVAMATLGGSLKRRESLTGRFSDALSWMFLAAAVLRRFEAEGRRSEDEPFFSWSMEHALARTQDAFAGIARNFGAAPSRHPVLGWIYRGPLAFWMRLNPLGADPSDALGHRVAAALLTPGEQRERLLGGLYIGRDNENEPLGQLERAFELCFQAEAVLARIRDAMRSGTLPPGKPHQSLAAALAAGVITAEDERVVGQAEQARERAAQVDSFTQEDYMAGATSGSASESA